VRREIRYCGVSHRLGNDQQGWFLEKSPLEVTRNPVEILWEIDIFCAYMIISACPIEGGKPMPEANSTPFLSNPISRYPRIAPGPAQKPKLLDRLREALRSRHYSRKTEFRHGLFHLTHVDLFGPEIPSPLAGEGRGEGVQNGKTHSAIPWPCICWKAVMIFEPSRNFYAIAT